MGGWNWACKAILEGKPLTRESWSQAFIFWHQNDAYVIMDPEEGEAAIYMPSMGDMLAVDWVHAEGIEFEDDGTAIA